MKDKLYIPKRINVGFQERERMELEAIAKMLED